MIIYRITNSVNSKVYIGQTIRTMEERIASHRYESKKNRNGLPLYYAMAKYGFDKFTFEVIDNGSSIEELNKKEESHIDKLDSLHPNGYNMDNGGNNKNTSEVTRKKMSESRKKFLSNKENHPNWGKHLSKETRDKIGVVHKGKTISNEQKLHFSKNYSGENHPMFGKTFSIETRDKMSKSKKGKKNPNLGLSKRRQVLCLDTNTVYDSVKIAAESIGVSRSGIAMVARGEINQIKGFRFKYL